MLTLDPAQTARDQIILENFFTAFFADLAPFDDNLVLNAYGLPCWKPTLDAVGGDGPTNASECARFNWWVRGDGLPYLFRLDGTPAGFAIVMADTRHLAVGVDFELMDFYIAPKFRRQGIGRQAALKIFDRHRGRWQVFELARNMVALSFWHGLIHDYTNGNFENRAGGTEQRFDNALPFVTG